MKSLDQPKKQEKAKELLADFECACNTCPSQEECKAAQEAEKAASSKRTSTTRDECKAGKDIKELFES